MTARWQQFRHLTRRGQMSAVYYWLRQWFFATVPTSERCVMGSVVDPMVWCPRRARTLWCPHHLREIEREKDPVDG